MRNFLTVLLLFDVVGVSAITVAMYFSRAESTTFVAWLALACAMLALLQLHLRETA